MNQGERLAGELDDPVVAEALKQFKASVDAWSEAEYNRPRTARKTAWLAAASWRLAASWALGCVLVVGGVIAGLYEHHNQQELARIAAQKAAQERVAAEQTAAAAEKPDAAVSEKASRTKEAATADEDLLATVNSDVSRTVPTAMEPLAQMMDESGTSGNGTD